MSEQIKPKLNPSSIIERNGTKFVAWKGLLDYAHQLGLNRIHTELLQSPTEQNNQSWIFSCVAEGERGHFVGHGDANTNNVGPNIRNAVIRMAETRSKVRALRDYCNIGEAALEELEDYDVDPDGQIVDRPPAQPQQRTAPNAQASYAQAAQNPHFEGDQTVKREVTITPASGNPNVATPAQVRAIYSIARDQHSMPEREVDERSQTLFGAPPAELTRKQASDLITTLKGER